MTKRPRAETPLIGITPDSGTTPAGPSGAKGEPVIVLQTRYARALVEAGGIPVVLPIMPSRKAIRQALERLDGVLISGGNFDIDPRLYGEESIGGLGKLKEDRTAFELELISLSLERELPLLGVCGGAQAINIALGGSLYQDIATQLPQARSHEQSALKETGGHPIKIHAATKLKRIVREDVLEVNTTHHQAVRSLGAGLIVNATADDGVIEGIESQVHPFVLGVQWHPEFLIHRDSRQRKIFASFIAACKGVPPKLARS
jgi:putative glutamine amidotransferase